MVYLEKQFKGKKYYYYLTQSVRLEGNKYKKIRHLVSIENKKLTKNEEKLLEFEHIDEFDSILENYKPLKEKTNYKHSIFFEDEWRVFSKEDIKEINQIKKEYKKLKSKSNFDYYNYIKEEFIIRHSYDTNMVEGSTFTLKETEALLTKGLILEPHKQREVFEITNIRDAFDYIETYNKKLNNKFIKNVHNLITKNTLLYSNMEGRYRFKGINVKMGTSPYRTVPGDYVNRVMRELIIKYEEFYKKDRLGAIIRFYCAFIGVHPFLDGNGRTSRMLLNFLLMKENLPPINFIDKEHMKHIEYISDSINGNSHEPIAQFILNRIRLNHWTNR